MKPVATLVGETGPEIQSITFLLSIGIANDFGLGRYSAACPAALTVSPNGAFILTMVRLRNAAKLTQAR